MLRWHQFGLYCELGIEHVEIDSKKCECLLAMLATRDALLNLTTADSTKCQKRPRSFTATQQTATTISACSPLLQVEKDMGDAQPNPPAPSSGQVGWEWKADTQKWVERSGKPLFRVVPDDTKPTLRDPLSTSDPTETEHFILRPPPFNK